MIQRTRDTARIRTLFERFPVVAIVGARQVGKTTIARDMAASWPDPTHVFDLESPPDLARLAEPTLTLGPLCGLVILDEIQRCPELFPVLRVLADRPGRPARFLVLGSASPTLLRQSSESLAGRIAYTELSGFHLDEVGTDHLQDLWIRGGFPRSFLAPSVAASAEWRRQLVRTFLERDLPQLGVRTPSATIGRFWTMLAHYHGQTWNAADFARSFGVSSPTVQRYLDLLEDTFVVRRLRPWHESLKKRQVKAPKVYLRDSGLLHTLLNLETIHDVLGHPSLGASWEGFALQAIVRQLRARPDECYFWATHQGAELDLLVMRGRRRLGFEVKRTDQPRTTRSMHIVMADLGLDRLDVVHAGEHTFPLRKTIRALALSRLLEDLAPLG